MRIPPEVFLQASAIGAYGDRKLDDTPLDESSDWTEDFLSNVAQLWEASSDVADELGVRRIVFRTGIVLNNCGGRVATVPSCIHGRWWRSRWIGKAGPFLDFIR